MTQQRRHFFLHVDDDVRLTQILAQTCVLTAQLFDFFLHRIAFGLRPAFLRSQRLKDSIGPFSPPIGQQRRIQTFATEKSAEAAPRCSSDFSFFEDALFIFSGVGPPLWFGNYFWIWSRSRRRAGARFAWRCTALRLTSFAFAPFRAQSTPQRKNDRPTPGNPKRMNTLGLSELISAMP